MSVVTVQSLINKTRSRGDFQSSDFVTDAELIDFIDSSYKELIDILIEKDQEYVITTSDLTFVAGTDSYDLPTDMSRLLGVDLQFGGFWYNLKRYNWTDRNDYQLNNLGHSYYLPYNQYYYRLNGAEIKFIPEPTSTETLRLHYVPIPTTLTSTSDTLVEYGGWIELVVLFALRRCIVKEESSTAAVDAEIERQVKRIDVMAGSRDSDPESLSDGNDSNPYWYF